MNENTNQDPAPEESATEESATEESATEESPAAESTPEALANDDRGPCPHCREQIARIARKCRHCGEYRDSSSPVVDPAAGMAMSFSLGAVLVALTCVVSGIGVALVGPSTARVRRQANETTAIESLRAIAAAQIAFKDQDLDGDGVQNFATLGQLGMSGQLEPDLASGLHNLYVFEVGVAELASTERWMATATPISPEQSGARNFVVNHTGSIRYRAGRAFLLDLKTCEFPPGAIPVGADSSLSR